ncbi:hypothetical protein [Flagellimonas sp. 2504JD4-2]
MVFSSCELTYENNRRLLVQGSIEAYSGEATPDFPIEAYASGRFFTPVLFIPFLSATNEDIDLIGTSSSEENGSYKIVVISPENQNRFSLVINGENADGHSSEWPTVLVNGVNSLTLNNSTYSLPIVEIGKINDAELLIQRVSDATDTLEYEIRYNSTFQEINLEPDFEDLEDKQETDSGVLYPNQSESTTTINLPQGEKLQFSYRLLNNGIVASENIELSPDSQTNRYEFSF